MLRLCARTLRGLEALPYYDEREHVQAKALGYTEPDPRDDLAGMDVARKVTILARRVG